MLAGGGGGGAGGYITGSTPITGPESPLAVVIGAGGQGGSSDPYPAPKRQGYEGTDTTWNSMTAGYGGGGGYGNSTGANGNQAPNGSGGGGGGGVGSSRSGGSSGPLLKVDGGTNYNSGRTMVQVAVVVLVVLVMMVHPARVVMVVLEHRNQQPSEIQVTLPLETLGD